MHTFLQGTCAPTTGLAPTGDGVSGPRLRAVRAAEIRETFLRFFEERDHLRVPLGLAGAALLRSVGPAHHRRDAAVQALLQR